MKLDTKKLPDYETCEISIDRVSPVDTLDTLQMIAPRKAYKFLLNVEEGD